MYEDRLVSQKSGARYSALRYLQEKIERRCALLPDTFSELSEWKVFRSDLISFLKERLPVVERNEQRPDVSVALEALDEDLYLELVDVNLDGCFYMPVHVYRKRGLSGQMPAVIVCPGYCHPKNNRDIIDICLSLARAGMIALAVEYDSTGQRADRPDCATGTNNVTAVAGLLGISSIGLRVMDNLAAFRYLLTRTDVDKDRIGITGICQGSIGLWFTVAVCDGISAAAPLCGVTTYEAIALEYCGGIGGWSGTSPYFYDLLSRADVQHVLSINAPRPLFVQNNILDMHWPYSGFEKVRKFTENIYNLYNAAENCSFGICDAPHAYAEPFLSNITNWFLKVL